MKTHLENIKKTINDPLLEQMIYDELSKIFKELIDKKREETLYSFGIFTNDDYTYIDAIANSNFALKEEAKKYKQKKTYKAIALTDLEIRLKWNPGDWHYYSSLSVNDSNSIDEKLKSLKMISEQIIKELKDIDKAIEIIDIEIYQRLNNLFISCLRKLKQEHTLLTNQIIFSIWKGFQSDQESIFFVSKINEEEQAQKYVSELNLGNESYNEKSI